MKEQIIKPAVSLSSAELSIAELKNKDINIEKKYQEQFKYNEKAVGIRNMNTASSIRIPSNGDIEISASNKTAIILNNSSKTVNMYGETINMVSPAVRIACAPGGLIINGYQLNPKLYQLTEKFNTSKDARVIDDMNFKCSVRYWNQGDEDVPPHWDRKEIEIKPFKRMQMDDEYTQLLAELGIPV